VNRPLERRRGRGKGRAGRASSEVVPRDFACHAEGRGFESHHPLSRTHWKRPVLALRGVEARPSATIPPRRRIRFFLAVGLALVVGGCGSKDSGSVARPQSANLNWHENCGTRADPIPIATRRIVVERGVWRVRLSFRNRTRVTLFIVRPHIPGGTYFGLEPFRTSSWSEVLERAPGGSSETAHPRRAFQACSSAATPARTRLVGRVLRARWAPGSGCRSVLFSGVLCLSDSRRSQSFPGDSSVSRSGSSASVDRSSRRGRRL
jgi:hypothetical protein